jgi:hypothetical protein
MFSFIHYTFRSASKPADIHPSHISRFSEFSKYHINAGGLAIFQNLITGKAAYTFDLKCGI